MDVYLERYEDGWRAVAVQRTRRYYFATDKLSRWRWRAQVLAERSGLRVVA